MSEGGGDLAVQSLAASGDLDVTSHLLLAWSCQGGCNTATIHRLALLQPPLGQGFPGETTSSI